MKQFYFEENIEEVQNAFLLACQLLEYNNINLDTNIHKLEFKTKYEGLFTGLHEVTIIFNVSENGTNGIATFKEPAQRNGHRNTPKKKKVDRDYGLIIESVSKILNQNKVEIESEENIEDGENRKERNLSSVSSDNKPQKVKTDVYEQISKESELENAKNKNKSYRMLGIVAVFIIIFVFIVVPIISSPRYNTDDWNKVENELMWKSEAKVKSILGTPNMTNGNSWTYFRKVKNNKSDTKCSLYLSFAPDGSGVYEINYGNCGKN